MSDDLVSHLLDSVAILTGVGGVFAPWQIRRMGRARIDVERERLLVLARTERDVEEIRAGRAVPIRDDSGEIRLLTRTHSGAGEEGATRNEIAQAALTGAVVDALRRDTNVARALIEAERALKDDPDPPPDKRVDPDWLLRWRDAAGQVSSEELQNLWGRVLAGELKAPGKFSYRALEFLRSVTREEAEQIEALGSCVANSVIIRPSWEIFQELGLQISDFHEMQRLGLISGVESIGSLEFRLPSIDPSRFQQLLLFRSKALLISGQDASARLTLPVLMVTRLGGELFGLGKAEPRPDYLAEVGITIAGAGFEVVVKNWSVGENGHIVFRDSDDQTGSPDMM